MAPAGSGVPGSAPGTPATESPEALGDGARSGDDVEDEEESEEEVWRQHCERGGGSWVSDTEWPGGDGGGWCTYPGEYKGDCKVDMGVLTGEGFGQPGGPSEVTIADTVRDQCRYYGGHWYSYEDYPS